MAKRKTNQKPQKNNETPKQENTGMTDALLAGFQNANTKILNEAAANTAPAGTGDFFNPPPGQYTWEIIEGSKSREHTYRSDNSVGTVLDLKFKILESTADENHEGVEFLYTFFLKPWTDPKTGETKIIDVGRLKAMYSSLTGEEAPDDVIALWKTIASAVGSAWDVEVRPQKDKQGRIMEGQTVTIIKDQVTFEMTTRRATTTSRRCCLRQPVPWGLVPRGPGGLESSTENLPCQRSSNQHPKKPRRPRARNFDSESGPMSTCGPSTTEGSAPSGTGEVPSGRGPWIGPTTGPSPRGPSRGACLDG